MTTAKLIAITLLFTGASSLLYGGIIHISEAKGVSPDTLQFRMMKEQKVNIPITLGIGCLLFGSFIFALRNKF
jgi:hypothetical protein